MKPQDVVTNAISRGMEVLPPERRPGREPVTRDGGRPEERRSEPSRVEERLQRASDAFDRRLSFSIHEGSERIWVRVIDRDTNEVVKEIPPEELLDVIASIRSMVGLLLDEKV